jgi:hypothetical protein
VPIFDRERLPPPACSIDAFGKPMGRQEMREMLEPAMLIGLGAVAVWFYLRYPRLRPRSLVLSAVHVAVSFVGFALLPSTLNLLVPLLPSHALQPYAVLALLIAVLTYVLLSWVWLIARILQSIGGNPRGGHPVGTDS